MGSQWVSDPYHHRAREVVRSGALGPITRIEQVWNVNQERWRNPDDPDIRAIRQSDTDWQRWLLGRPARPFDPRVYFEFRLYRDFSSGIADQWMSHAIDMVHNFLNDPAPTSVVAHGGIFAWNDGRENPDTFQALLEYPKGFMVSYSTSFGNDSDSYSRFMGKKATLLNIGGEGSQRWKVIEEKGTHEANPFVKRSQRLVTLEGDQRRKMSWTQKMFSSAVENTYGPLTFTSDSNSCHMRNWFECLRSRRQPNANIDRGFSHSVAVIMAARSYQEGRRLYWDAVNEQITAEPAKGRSL
jgi:predicted dehydrogenase